jgi:hypothetical protein
MNVKKSLESRIRVWLPKAPNLPQESGLEGSGKKKSRIFFAQSPLGLKLVVALFWIFGFGGILLLIEQSAQMAYLPLNFRILMAAVTAADSIAMFVIGAGLLTMKRRWIDAAITFSIISFVLFYLVPLRLAIPLEIVAIVYLAMLRKSLSLKPLTRIVPVALLLLLCGAMFHPVFAGVEINPSKTLVKSYSQLSDKGNFNVTVNVYQYADLDDEHDYYFLDLNLQCSRSNFNHAKINSSISQEATIAISWIPQSNPAPLLTIGFGVASFYVGNIDTVFVYVDHEAANICWMEETLNLRKEGIFSTDLIVPQDAHFIVDNLNAEAGSHNDLFGSLWMDELSFEDFKI